MISEKDGSRFNDPKQLMTAVPTSVSDFERKVLEQKRSSRFK